MGESPGHVAAERCQQRDKDGHEGGPQGPSLEWIHVRPLVLTVAPVRAGCDGSPAKPPFTYIMTTWISSSIEVIERFPTADALLAYFGIVPSVRDSADTHHHGRITKTGDILVRHLAVEAAVSHTRWSPGSTITKFYMRLKKRKGMAKARVAAAAKLLRAGYWMLREDRDFSDIPPPPPTPGKRGCRT